MSQKSRAVVKLAVGGLTAIAVALMAAAGEAVVGEVLETVAIPAGAQ